MLRNIYVPSHAETETPALEIPVEHMLEELATARPAVAAVHDESLPIPIVEGCYDVYFRAGFLRPIPYVKGLRFQLEENDDATSLHIERMDVGDERLRGNGIGTQLLQKAIEFGAREKDNLTTLTTGPANMGLVNTICKVLNRDSEEEHVSFRKRGTWYGAGYDKPLEAVFDDVKYHGGDRYLVQEVRAAIDCQQFLGETTLRGAITQSAGRAD